MNEPGPVDDPNVGGASTGGMVMVVLNQPNSDDPRMYDLSFMHTKRCDLACSFCMYSSGPRIRDHLDLERLKPWLATVDWNLIASFGAYGGEVSIDLDGWSRIFELLPVVRPRFVITNGSWSLSRVRTERFMLWCQRWDAYIIVSGTPEHRRYQNRAVLEALQRQFPDNMRLKPEDENLHAMGRLKGKMPFACSVKCMFWNRAKRIAVQPDGTIIFQNCDGEYPIVGTIEEPFGVVDNRIRGLRKRGFASVCEHYDQALARRNA